MARSSAGLAIEKAQSRRALSLYRADEAVKAYGLARIMAGGLPNYLELSYGQTTLRHEEQYKHYTGWAYCAITRIATRVAGQKIKMGRKVEEPSPLSWAWDRPPGRKLPDEDRWRAPTFVKTLDTDIEQIESHPLLEALADPNPIMVPWTLLFHTIASLLITGKTYWWFIEGDDGLQIWPVPSDWVTPVHTDDELFVAYRVRPLGGVGTEGQLVDADEMAYFYLPDPGAPIGAVSPLQSQAPAIAVEEQMQIAQYRSMKNGVNPGVMIMAGRHPSMTGIGEGPRVILSPSQKRELYAAVKQSWQGAANFNTPIIVDGGLIQGVERFTLTPQELDFLQSETMVKARIFQAFGVSPIIAGEIAGVNRAQAAVADALFTANVVNPLCEMIGQTMTKYIGEKDVYFWIETAHADDAEMKLRNWQVLCQYGAVTKNDLRREIGGLPPVEDGDEYVAPAGAGGSAFGGGAFGPPQPPKEEATMKKPPPGTAGEATPATEEEGITGGEKAGKPTRLKYDPDQPRASEGSPEGGQFASEGGGQSSGGKQEPRQGGSAPPDLDKTSAKQMAALSKDEKDAIAIYTGGWSMEINTALRGGTQMRPAVKEAYNTIQKAFAKAPPLPPGTEVYRGMFAEAGAAGQFFSDVRDAVKSGKAISMKGIASTSVDKKVAVDIAKKIISSPTVERALITIRPKTGLAISFISKYPEQKEILLDHGKAYRVVSYKEKAKLPGVARQKFHLIELEEV